MAGPNTGVPDVEEQFQALKHHGEAIGWIVQGEPDEGLRSVLLGEWRRALDEQDT